MAKTTFALGFFLLFFSCSDKPQPFTSEDVIKTGSDVSQIIEDLQRRYIYVSDKKVDFTCLEETYHNRANEIKSRGEALQLFEHLIYEFYDSHVILNTNTSESYRLYAPIYVRPEKGKYMVSHAWYSQTENLPEQLIGAELISMNEQPFEEVVSSFPTACHDKSDPEIREWIANKALAGVYNQPRALSFISSTGDSIHINLDDVEIIDEHSRLTSHREGDIGVIRINNSLGRSRLINTFDKALDELMETKGLILDLRNTVDGGDSYIARAIMGRFIDQEMPYQKHWYMEDYGNHDPIERVWQEYVTPRDEIYNKPIVVIVGRWTGSMGEGLAIGMDGMNRATVIGTEMERLAGSMEGFSFKNRAYGYRLSTQKLFHIDGTPREDYVPSIYIQRSARSIDEAQDMAMSMLQ